MGWKQTEAKAVDLSTLTPSQRERMWVSAYPNSLERWTKDFEVVGYKLIGEYDLGDNKTLYRFGPKKPLPPTETFYYNVVIEIKPINAPE